MKKLIFFILSISIFLSFSSCNDNSDRKIKNNTDTLEENINIEEYIKKDLKESINPFIIYSKKDGLYLSYINDKKNIKIADGEEFSYPKISPKGSFVSYEKDDGLFIYNVKTKEIKKIVEGIDYYLSKSIWIEDDIIVYDSGNGGFIKYNITKDEKIEHIDEYCYADFTYYNNKFYAVRYLKWTEEEIISEREEGIVEIDLNNYNDNKFENRILIYATEATDEKLEYAPRIYGVSPDGKYLWIMEKYASGSTSADIGGIGLYDLEKNTHIDYSKISEDQSEIFDEDENSEDIFILPSKGNLAINKEDSKIIGVIKGAQRERFFNKETMIYKLKDDNSLEEIHFMDKDLVGKTPRFTLDGEDLLYSSTDGIDMDDIEDYNESYKNWYKQSHDIFKYNLKNNKIEKLTNGNRYYTLPFDIGDNTTIYFELVGEEYRLIKLKDGVEEEIVTGIQIDIEESYNCFLDIIF